MRQDIIVGVAISALIHAGVLFEGRVIPSPRPIRKPPEKAPVTDVIEMRKLEDDDPPLPDPSLEEQKPIEIAPPSQEDVPQVVPQDAFVQRLQPPQPESLKPSDVTYRIPADRPTGSYRNIPIIDSKFLDQQPIARVKSPPQYPFEMRQNGTSGEVLVDFIVDTNGNVLNAHAVQSTQREFEESAVQAVSRWKFRPGRKGGQVVNTHMQVPIVFNLNGDR